MESVYRDLQGKAAIVTGGTKGIGLGAARRIAQNGGNVVICGAGPDGLSVAKGLQAEGLNVLAKRTDIRKANEVQQLIEFAVENFGRLDILVNSAGIQRYGDVVETSEDVWNEVLDVNVKGIFLASKYAIPEMRKQGKGAIVNVSSVQAFAAQKKVAAYAASKGAINALTRAMAVDLANEGIRVNVVCPASVDTPMLRNAAELFKGELAVDDVLKSWGNMHPVGRLGTQDDVGELIAFLASDSSSFITGEELKIDGGLLSALGVSLPE